MSAGRPSAREVAYRTLLRVDHDGAYANLLLRATLDRSKLADRDRRFVTELVNGTTRRRRACDALIDRFVAVEPAPETRTLLRLGTYQLAFAGVPVHAAVGETVELAPKRQRGFVNAVLRKVAATPMVEWPSEAVRLSYPDWIVDRLSADLGADDALAALAAMNEPPSATVRADGYVQDEGSQWVAAAVGVQPGDVVLDACAAPGGKATAMAAEGAFVVAADISPARVGLIAANVRGFVSRPDRAAPGEDATRTGSPASVNSAVEPDPGTVSRFDRTGFGQGATPSSFSASVNSAVEPDPGTVSRFDRTGFGQGATPSSSSGIGLVVADGTASPFAPATFDRVLLDAGCRAAASAPCAVDRTLVGG